MKTRHAIPPLAMCAFVLAGASSARAQEPITQSFDRLPMALRLGDTVTVTDAAGHAITGRVADISAATLSLMVKSARRDLSEADVVRIESDGHRHPGTGAAIGLGIGAALGALVVSHAGGGDYAFAGALVYGGIGAALGSGFGALAVTYDVIYAAPAHAPSRAARVQVAPFATRDRRGVALSLKF